MTVRPHLSPAPSGWPRRRLFAPGRPRRPQGPSLKDEGPLPGGGRESGYENNQTLRRKLSASRRPSDSKSSRRPGNSRINNPSIKVGVGLGRVEPSKSGTLSLRSGPQTLTPCSLAPLERELGTRGLKPSPHPSPNLRERELDGLFPPLRPGSRPASPGRGSTGPLPLERELGARGLDPHPNPLPSPGRGS